MKYPILILTRDRPDQFLDMVNSILCLTDPDTYRLIICDNASTSPKMVAYLNLLESEGHTIIRNERNLLFEGLNPGLALVDTDFFLISDPDIVLNPKTPFHWILRLKEALEAMPMSKIGLALDVNFDYENDFTKGILEIESRYWKETMDIPGINQPCYVAAVDTTMAMYRRDTFEFWDKGMMFDKDHGITDANQIRQSEYNKRYYIPVARVAGDYTATHTGWDKSGKYAEDQAYYMKTCDAKVASTLSR